MPSVGIYQKGLGRVQELIQNVDTDDFSQPQLNPNLNTYKTE